MAARWRTRAALLCIDRQTLQSDSVLPLRTGNRPHFEFKRAVGNRPPSAQLPRTAMPHIIYAVAVARCMKMCSDQLGRVTGGPRRRCRGSCPSSNYTEGTPRAASQGCCPAHHPSCTAQKPGGTRMDSTGWCRSSCPRNDRAPLQCDASLSERGQGQCWVSSTHVWSLRGRDGKAGRWPSNRWARHPTPTEEACTTRPARLTD